MAYHSSRRAAAEKWGGCKRKGARFLFRLTSAELPNRNTSDGERLLALQPFAGFAWGRPAMRAAGPNEPAGIIQSSLRLHATAELAKKPRGNLHEVWRAPPYLTAQDPHPWRDLIASAGLSGTATELRENKAMEGQNTRTSFPLGCHGRPWKVRSGGAQMALPRPHSLIGKTRGARRPRSVPPWHIANTRYGSKLAGASPSPWSTDSAIGGEAAARAPTAGLPDQDRDNMGPRAQLLNVTENAVSV